MVDPTRELKIQRFFDEMDREFAYACLDYLLTKARVKVREYAEKTASRGENSGAPREDGPVAARKDDQGSSQPHPSS